MVGRRMQCRRLFLDDSSLPSITAAQWMHPAHVWRRERLLHLFADTLPGARFLRHNYTLLVLGPAEVATVFRAQIQYIAAACALSNLRVILARNLSVLWMPNSEPHPLVLRQLLPRLPPAALDWDCRVLPRSRRTTGAVHHSVSSHFIACREWRWLTLAVIPNGLTTEGHDAPP
jgi:hypothetical protein